LQVANNRFVLPFTSPKHLVDKPIFLDYAPKVLGVKGRDG